jgi:uncharacterized protein YukE
MDNLNEEAVQQYQGTIKQGKQLCTLDESKGGFAEYFHGDAAMEKGKEFKDLHPKLQERAAISAILMKNTNDWLQSMNETTRALTVGGFADHIFSMIRASMTNNPVMDLVSVQPMTQAIGRIFFLNYVVGQTKGAYTKGKRVFDALEGYQGGSTLSDEIIQGENLTDATVSTAYTGQLSYLPVQRGSVTISFNGGVDLVMRDDGNGGWVKVSGTNTVSAGTINYQTGAFTLTAGGNLTATGVAADYQYDAETSGQLPQIDIEISAVAVQAKQRAMRMRYSTNGAYDFKQQFGEDVDGLLVAGVSDLIKAEIAREVVTDLWNAAGAPVATFSVGAVTGISLAEHFADLLYPLNQADGAIYQATQQAHGNWLIVDVNAANLIKTIPAPVFQAAPIDDVTQGVQFIGRLNGQFDVYMDRLLSQEAGASALGNILMGHKGGDFRTSGYVYAPYQPITTTMSVTLDDLLTRKALNTRYAKKMVNSRMYRKISFVA